MHKSRFISVSLSLIIISSLFMSFFPGCAGETQTATLTTTETLTSTQEETLKQLVYQGMYTYDDFDTPETCGSCHIDIYSDWSNSLMGTNYLKQWKQVEYFQLAYAQSQQVDQVAGVASGCIQCHAPLAFLSGDIPPAEASEGTRANESVSCEICHSLTGSSEEEPFNFSAIMALGNTKYGPRYDSESTYHETELSYFVGSPEHCALCHDEQSPYGAWVKETYREWAAGGFADQNITCIECHMDTTTGRAALDGKERDDLAVHSFMAVHTPERLADDITINPSTDSTQVKAGDTVTISVDLSSLECGHYFPSGSTEERMLWLEVWAEDSDGNRYHIPVDAKGFTGEEYTIADSTAIAYSDMGEVMGIEDFAGVSRDGDVPDGARIFRRPFFNPDGEMTIMQWYTAENTLVDYRFAPRETKTETYTWEVPADIASGTVTIEFNMYYSLVPSSVGEFLELGEEYYTAYSTGSSSLTIDVGATTTTTTTSTSTSSLTFGEMAIKGEQNYGVCMGCHGNGFIATAGKTTLSYYKNAQNLLDKISTMPGGFGQGGREILSYFLIEHGWISADAIFDLNALAEILLPRN